jgi:hydrogenase maturation protease
MGDDGVGPAAVEALRRRGVSDRAELIDAGLAFSDALCDLQPSRPLLVIDAVRGGGPPGTVYRLGPGDLAEEAGSLARSVSLHEVSVLPALRMEALAGREFADVTVLGVEPGEVAWGERLSPPVAEALEKVVDEVCRYLEMGATAALSGSRGFSHERTAANGAPVAPSMTGVDTI